jgi:hypothetical protein
VTSIDASVAVVIVSVVEPEMLPVAAVMIAEPSAKAIAVPLEPTALLIYATAKLDELQATDVVRSCVEPSE